MKVSLVVNAACFLLGAFAAVGVDSQATAHDVRMLQLQVNILKQLIASTDAEIKRANDLFAIFSKSADKVSDLEDNWLNRTQHSCNHMSNLQMSIIRKHSTSLGKMLTSRSNRTYSAARGSLFNTIREIKSMATALNSNVHLATNISKMNKELSKETAEHTKSIQGALQEQSLDDVQKDLFLANRQIQQVQFSEFERTRSDGYSGIKQIKSNSGIYTFFCVNLIVIMCLASPFVVYIMALNPFILRAYCSL